jgi:hypothetical protein
MLLSDALADDLRKSSSSAIGALSPSSFKPFGPSSSARIEGELTVSGRSLWKISLKGVLEDKSTVELEIGSPTLLVWKTRHELDFFTEWVLPEPYVLPPRQQLAAAEFLRALGVV